MTTAAPAGEAGRVGPFARACYVTHPRALRFVERMILRRGAKGTSGYFSQHSGTRGLPLLKVSLAYHRRAQPFAPIMSRMKWGRRGVPAVDIELLSLGQRVERAHSSKIRLNSALRTSDRATSAPPANHAWPCPAANRQVNGLRVLRAAGSHRFAACRLCRSWREMPWAVRSIQLSLANGQLDSRSAVKGQRDAQVTV
jgi:hypothetical protein